jgi:hypothetical protein
MVLTFPSGCHMVTNYENNIAIDVNITPLRYLSIVRKSNKCDCVAKDTTNCAADDEQESMFLEVNIFFLSV